MCVCVGVGGVGGGAVIKLHSRFMLSDDVREQLGTTVCWRSASCRQGRLYPPPPSYPVVKNTAPEYTEGAVWVVRRVANARLAVLKGG